MSETRELIVERDGDEAVLLSPAPGLFTRALPEGALLGGGAPAGVLHVLGREVRLVAPAGVHGRIVSEAPDRVRRPVGHREALYRLAPLAAESAAAEDPAELAGGEAGLLLTAAQSGRFYHRPGPDEPLFAPPGTELADGDPVGLIEVMKTFAHVPYRAQGGLPARARVVRVIAGDGAEIREGEPLLEVEPA